jgi:hypothetical protein
MCQWDGRRAAMNAASERGRLLFLFPIRSYLGMTEGDRLPAPMTLGNMRSLGPRDLDVTCKACGHRQIVNVDAWPDDVTVLSFGPRMSVGDGSRD